MNFKFKLSPTRNQSQWIGWFGDNVMKVRVHSELEHIFQNFLNFLQLDLGIEQKNIKILNQNIHKRMIELELPDQAWELFLGVVEK